MSGTYVQWPPVSSSSGGGGVAGANTSLSNLVATSINQSLVPASDQSINVGSPSKTYSNGYIQNVFTSTVSSIFDGQGITLQAADSADQPSGNVVLSVGNGVGGQGSFQFIKSSVSNNIGDVWTASATNGIGYWSTPAGGSLPTSSLESYNLGLKTTVGSSSMTIQLKQADGATDPGAGSGAVIIGFTGSAATGAYTIASAGSALSVVIPSGATLGQVSSVSQYIWVYAINDSGLDLGVSGVKVFDDGTLQSTTAIGSGLAISGTTIYSTNTHTNKPIRLIGRALVNEGTAGTWLANATEVKLMPTPQITSTDWASYTPTIASLGTPTNVSVWWRRNGPVLELEGRFTSGNTTHAAMTMTLPSGILATTLSGSTEIIGLWAQDQGGGNYAPTLIASNNSNILNLSYQGNSSTAGLSFNGFADAILGSGANMAVKGNVPIKGWSTYGP